MVETTTVLSIDGDIVTVGCIATGCSSCAGNSFCNIQGKSFTAKNTAKLELKPGDLVEIYLPPGKTIFSGFMVLMFPLILFIAGFILTGRIRPGASEGLQALGGFMGLVLGFGIGYLFGRIKKNSYTPIVQNRITQDQEQDQE